MEIQFGLNDDEGTIGLGDIFREFWRKYGKGALIQLKNRIGFLLLNYPHIKEIDREMIETLDSERMVYIIEFYSKDDESPLTYYYSNNLLFTT